MEGKLSRLVYLDPHPPEYQSKIILLKLSEDVSVIDIIQAKYSCFLCGIVPFMGGGQTVQASLSCLHPPEYQSNIILLIVSILKISECEDVSIINIIQVKFSHFLCHSGPYA